jgi:beta-N-acetylhexosaminidase
VPASTRRRIGQLLIGSLPGRTVTPEWRALAREFDVGGAILFARNVEAPEQIAGLTADLGALSPSGAPPPWMSVDQEGGRVLRLRAPFTEWPSMATLGRSGDEALARRFGAALSAELRGVGITLDYAPVLDVHTNPANPVIGDRALAGDPAEVARLGGALIDALQQGGLAACGKHFPGHGDTALDSHVALPVVEQGLDRLRRVEFVPFREAVRREAAFIMTAHVLVPALDEARPATLSPAIVDGLLRRELGFEGAILSDDLEMRAITDAWTVPDAAVAAVAAGCDGVLVCSGDLDLQAATLEALVHAVEDGRIPVRRLDAAIRRLEAQKHRFPGDTPGPAPWREVVGCEAHQRIADEMAQFA